MRKREYLSPTQISLYHSDPTEYYLKYLTDDREDREPQTPAMAVGSAFDAFVKAYLNEKLFGKDSDPRFKLESIFNDQVEEHNRKQAWQDGEYCFTEYKKLGALDNLLLQLGKAIGRPRFEMDVKATIVDRKSTVGGVPFNGKPDCFYTNEEGAHVILDWKVNGFYSKQGVSPMKGYVWLREDGKFPTTYGDKCGVHKGIFINLERKFEELNLDWARQLCIYSWLCGEEVESEFVAQVHQLVCRPTSGSKRPAIRVAEHSMIIKPDFQRRVFEEATELWARVNSDHFFAHLSKEESIARCKLLDERAAAMRGGDDFFSQMSRM
jgi:hypothetical protein